LPSLWEDWDLGEARSSHTVESRQIATECTELRDLGDRVLVLGQVRGRGRMSGAEVDGRWAWIVELREGKAARLRGFLDHCKALEAAGLRE
jgi:ketosteroid isomerase-like protein